MADDSRTSQGHESDSNDSESGVKKRRRSKPVRVDADFALSDERPRRAASKFRKKRCGKCEGCLAPECGACDNCRFVIMVLLSDCILL